MSASLLLKFYKSYDAGVLPNNYCGRLARDTRVVVDKFPVSQPFGSRDFVEMRLHDTGTYCTSQETKGTKPNRQRRVPGSVGYLLLMNVDTRRVLRPTGVSAEVCGSNTFLISALQLTQRSSIITFDTAFIHDRDLNI